MYFDELDLNDHVLDALYDMRFDTCTPVQENCIPHILEGKDVLGVAQTGTGKTAAYLLPIISKLEDGGYPKDATNCVIMAPTRELAQQIDQAMQGFSYYLPDVNSVAVYGGNDGGRYDQEVKGLTLGADVIIATPGRLISHITMGNVDFSRVSFFVLDEADRMLDMGFSEDIMTIAKLLPPTCQMIMFSATMPDKIEELAGTLLKNPAVVKLAVSKPAEKIKQSAYVCYDTQKLGIIKHLFKQGDLSRVIIFSGKKQKVKQIQQALQRLHINSGEMHSDLDQSQRDEMMFQFKSGKIDVLVATDIVARGIDIDDIAMVINFDVPRDAEDYVHRIGRTARADRDGVAITFVSPDDIRYFKEIERFLDKTVEKVAVPEELGEAPEYKAPGRSAKKTRRDDRNNNAHRRKPRQKADEKRQPKERSQEQGKDQGKEQKGEQRGNRREEQRNGQNKRQRPDSGQPQQAKEPNENRRKENRRRENKTGDNRRENSQPREEKDDRRQHREQRQKQAQRNSGAPSQRKNRQPNKPKATNEPRNRDANSPKTAAQNPSGLKSIIQKPLKWLRSLKK